MRVIIITFLFNVDYILTLLHSMEGGPRITPLPLVPADRLLKLVMDMNFVDLMYSSH